MPTWYPSLVLRRTSRLIVDGLRCSLAAIARMDRPVRSRSPISNRSSSDKNRAEIVTASAAIGA